MAKKGENAKDKLRSTGNFKVAHSKISSIETKEY
jgi:hypothetical protein